MKRKNGNGKTQIVSFHLPIALLEAIDRLVEAGVFHNRSEAIRTAVYMMVREENRKKTTQPVPVAGYR